MARGAKQKWSDAQIAAVRAEALRGTPERQIARMLKAGEVPGYSGDPMPPGTVSYHARQARQKALESARSKFEARAIDEQIGGFVARALKAAEQGERKMHAALRAGKPEGWVELEQRAKTLLQVKRLSDAINGAKPGPNNAKPPKNADRDENNSSDLVTQLAQSTEPKTGAETR